MGRILIASLLLLAATTTFAATNIRAVAPERLGSYWRMTNTEIDADVPNIGRNMDKPGCAAVSYTVGADGKTRDIVVRRVVPNGDLGKVAASAVADLHYAPANGNDAREPAYTYIIMPFNLPPDPAVRERVTAACKLTGFPQGYP
ncbi:MAG: energy transducer TonB [Rhodanobacteraceae bacterium]